MREQRSRNCRYDITDSPLYKVGTKKKLAVILGLLSEKDFPTLLSIDVPYAKFHIIKKGKPRFCEEPCPPLKDVHVRILDLLQRIKTPDYLHSGVKKRSYVSNAKVHLCAGEVSTLDIKKFYPSVSREMVSRFFRITMKCPSDVAAILADLTTCDGHIPTGSPLSQLLAYFVCKDLFDEIGRNAAEAGIRFTCYVDDLTFSGEKIDKAWLYEKVKRPIRRFGMAYHKEKYYKEGTPREVTGVILDGDLMKVCNRHLKHTYDLTVLLAEASDLAVINRLHAKISGCLSAAGQIDHRMNIHRRKINEFVRSKIAANRARARSSSINIRL